MSQLNFPAFTSNTLMFANKEAANAFFAAITINAAEVDIPGLMAQAELPATALPAALAFDPNTYVFTIQYVDAVSGLTQQVNVVKQETIDAMIAAFNTLRTYVAELQASTQAAGQLSS